MKIFKNIVRLLALTSLSLSFSPLTTAKAVTVNNALGGTTTTGSTNTDTSTSADASNSDKSDTSTVTVNVLSGILTLDAVPDFNFGSMMIGSTAKLASNTVDLDDGFNSDSAAGDVTSGADGNSAGTLQMTDSRNTSGSDNMPGFVLTAKMGQLVNSTSDDDSIALNAILNLSSIPLVDSNDENVSNTESNLSTEKAAITSDGNSATVIKMTKGSYRPGVIKAKFNTPDSASLTIPKDGQSVTTSKDPSSKNVNAVVTWTLSANPTVTD